MYRRCTVETNPLSSETRHHFCRELPVKFWIRSVFHSDFFHIMVQKKNPNFKIATTLKSITYVFTITSNDQISYYSPTVLSPSLRCLYIMLTPLQNDMVFLQHLNRIPLTAHKWAVDIGSSSTHISKLIFASECTDGGHSWSDVHLLSLFEVWEQEQGELMKAATSLLLNILYIFLLSFVKPFPGNNRCIVRLKTL
jgi:hypothetical protein